MNVASNFPDLPITAFSATEPTEPWLKWGEALHGGFQVLPDMLLKHQGDLGLSPTDIVVVCHLTMQWWYRDRLPYPGSALIARRMGVEQRTVQRSLRRLANLGLITRARGKAKDGRAGRAYSLEGLVDKLKAFARSDPSYETRLRTQMESASKITAN